MAERRWLPKYRLYKSLVLSILLYGCETWTLLAKTEKRIRAFEVKSMRKLLLISYVEHRTNTYVRSNVESLVGPQEPLLACVKRRKLTWFGHVMRHDSLCKTIDGVRRRGRQLKSWSDNVKDRHDHAGHPDPGRRQTDMEFSFFGSRIPPTTTPVKELMMMF